MSKRRYVLIIILSLLTLLCAVGASTWIITTPLTASPTWEDRPQTQICYIVRNRANKYYSSIEAAIADAAAGESIYTIPGNEYTLNNSITLSDNVSLYLTYDGNTSSSSIDGMQNSGAALSGDTTAANVTNNRKFLLNLRNGADIVVESGSTLGVGGKYGTMGCVGEYCEINLGKDSSITVNGTFQCYGYVKENNDDAVNPYNSGGEIYDNSNDSGRFIEVTASGTLQSYMVLQDAMNGTTLYSAIDSQKVCPFWTYDFPAMQTYTKYNAESQFTVKTTINISNIYRTATATVIGGKNATAALFRIASGSLDVEYYRADGANSGVLYTSAQNSRTGINVCGDVTLGSIIVENDVKPINSSNFFIPISYKESVHVLSGATMHVNSQVKFLTESSLYIDEDATVELNSDLIFYTTQAVALSNTTHKTHTSEDAKLVNNGTIVVNRNGAIGGYITHTREVGAASIDLTNASANALSVSAIDDEAEHTVTVKTAAPFLAIDDEPEAGTLNGELITGATYVSGFNNATGTEIYYWIGEHAANTTVRVNVESTSYRYEMSSYTLYESENASADNQKTNSANSSQDFEVKVGNYIKIEAPFVDEVKVFANGTEEEYDSTKWIRVTGETEITIVPSEGSLIVVESTAINNRYAYITANSNSSNLSYAYKEDTAVNLGVSADSESGRGSIDFAIYSSLDSTAGFTAIATGSAGSCKAIIKKGSYFRVQCTAKGSSAQSVSFKNYCYWTGDGEDMSGAPDVRSGFDPSSNNWNTSTYTFKADNDGYALTFGFAAQAICIVEGTLVMLADGTQKKVEDLKYGDMLLAFNHLTGEYEASPMLVNLHAQDSSLWCRVIYLTFSDGTEIGVITEHAFFDCDLNEYVYIGEENAADYIGHRFVKVLNKNGEFVSGEVVLTEVEVVKEYVKRFSPVSGLINIVTEGLLSFTEVINEQGPIHGAINIFEFDEDMKYNKAKMQADIEKYGLYTYEDFKEYMSYEEFINFPWAYFKVAVGKGQLKWEDIIWNIDYIHNEWLSQTGIEQHKVSGR